MSKPVHISMIAAVADNNVIGLSGGMPWRLPSDMAFFKATTMGKPIIMGRKQFETVGKPLPGRVNIVVTRQSGYQPDGVVVINDFTAAIEHAKAIAEADGVDEVMIIGGGEIYALGMDIADRLYITHVDASPDGDTWFPQIDPEAWKETGCPPVSAGEHDSAPIHAVVYERK
jgi:dihydrofolate reductase